MASPSKERVTDCRPAAPRKTGSKRSSRVGSIYTLSRIGAHGHIWSAMWKLLLTEALHWLRCFWRARVAGVHDFRHSVYVTPVTTRLASLTPKLRLLVLVLFFQWLRSFGLYQGGCTCHRCLLTN